MEVLDIDSEGKYIVKFKSRPGKIKLDPSDFRTCSCEFQDALKKHKEKKNLENLVGGKRKFNESVESSSKRMKMTSSEPHKQFSIGFKSSTASTVTNPRFVNPWEEKEKEREKKKRSRDRKPYVNVKKLKYKGYYACFMPNDPGNGYEALNDICFSIIKLQKIEGKLHYSKRDIVHSIIAHRHNRKSILKEFWGNIDWDWDWEDPIEFDYDNPPFEVNNNTLSFFKCDVGICSIDTGPRRYAFIHKDKNSKQGLTQNFNRTLGYFSTKSGQKKWEDYAREGKEPTGVYFPYFVPTGGYSPDDMW